MQTHRHNLKAFVVLMAFFALIGLGAKINGQSAKDKLPPGKWTFAAGPYFGSDYESIPVDVSSVTSDFRKGLTVTSVVLQNRDARNVVAVKLHWYLKDKDQKGRVLLEGDSPLIGVAVPAGESQILNYPVVSFAKVHKPLLKGTELSGNFRIEVAVSEVQYEDSSVWLKGKSNWSSYQKAAHRISPLVKCQSQGCVYNGTPGIESYQCSSNSGTSCAPSSDGQSCTESRCPKAAGGT